MHPYHNGARDYNVKVSIPWPRDSMSADPNDFYRAWLTENVGKQYINWDWDVGRDGEMLDIYFMDEKVAMMFLLTKGERHG